jgi:large subunit ribosomal protein L19
MSKKAKNYIRPGDTIRVYQKILASAQASTDKQEKEKTQVFEGLVIARKHGSEPGATITVRKAVSGVGVEKIFPVHSPLISKIDVIKKGKVRRAKLYYLRKAKGQRAKIKEKPASVATKATSTNK